MTDEPPRRRARVRMPGRQRPPVHGPGVVGGAETTTATSQTVLLAVGGLLLAGAAVVFAVFGFGSVGATGRFGLLTLATLILLAMPLMLARRGLVATAETIASVGLLMVLLDGYVTWSLNVFAAESIPTPVYFGIVCLATAIIATLYRGTSHLVAPRYATVLVLQPVLPLLGYELIEGPAGWALAFTGVAALNLAMGMMLTRPGRVARIVGFVRPVHLHVRLPHPAPPPPPEPEPDADRYERPESRPEEPEDVKLAAGFPIEGEPVLGPPPPPPAAPPILRDATWVLFTLAFGLALSYASVALATTSAVPPTVRAALVLMLASSLGVLGALVWRRYPLPDLAGGLATLAVVFSITRVGTTSMPGHTLLFAALAVAVAAMVVPALPDVSRRGPRIASGVSAGLAAIYLIYRAVPAIVAPVQAARPWWHADLAAYAGRIGTAAGPAGWQLVIGGALLTFAVAVALPGWLKIDATVTGATLTLLTLPAGLHLSWLATPLVLVAAAIAIGATAVTAPTQRTADSYLAAAGVVGGYAALTSMTRPGVAAVTLAAITLGGYVIAMLRPVRTDPVAELAGQQVASWAGGGAAFALPGAVCCGLSALVAEQVFPGAGSSFVLAGGFVAVAGTLGYAAYRLITDRRCGQPLLLGTTLGAFAVFVGTLAAHHSSIVDMGVGILLLGSSIMLWLAPSMGDRIIFGQRLDGHDTAAAAVTASGVAALARVLALLVPGAGLVTTAIIVLGLAVAVRALPAEQRRGPVTGELVIGTVIAAVAGFAALADGVGVIRAANPWWHAALGTAWQHNAAVYAHYGWQGPLTLLLVAAAAAIVVPRPLGDDLAAVAIGLAAVGAPVAFGLAWWTPMMIGLLATMGLGVAAGLADEPRVAYTRAGVAGALAVYTAAASLVNSASTTATLESLAIAATLVAALAGVRLAAARTADVRARRAHLVPVGGGASAAAVLAVAGAAGALAAGEHRPSSVVLAAALAGTALALAVAGVACWRMPPFLDYVAAAVAVAGSVIALAAIPPHLPVGLYAATAALLGVLAELMRVNAVRRIGWRPEDGWQPAGEWSPRRSADTYDGWQPDRGWRTGRWRPASDTGFGAGAALASLVPAAIAVASVALPLVAALFGPYHFATHPWTFTARETASLHPFNGWAAHRTDALTTATLTLAGALAAVGLGGSRRLMSNRIVAVVVPGVALTGLLMPAALHQGQLQATFALLVATLCGLSLGLTVPPDPDSFDAGSLRIARRLVFVLAVLASLAGQLGSLATRSMTLEALGGSILVGLIGALGGKYPLARMIGWNVAVGTAELFALAASLAAGHPPRWAAFPLLAVVAVALAVADTLPRFRRTPSLDDEIMVIEGTALLGMIGALGLTLGQPRYTGLICTALGAVLGIAISRPDRVDRHRQVLIFAAAAVEVLGIWLVMSSGTVGAPEAYVLPFAAFALLVGGYELSRRPDLGSWLAYGPALVAGFLPTLAVVLVTDAAPVRRVLLIVAGVLTVAVGSLVRQKAPVVVGTVVTATTTLHELLRLSTMLPWWVLLLVFGAAGALLISLGATYEKQRSKLTQWRGALNRFR